MRIRNTDKMQGDHDPFLHFIGPSCTGEEEETRDPQLECNLTVIAIISFYYYTYVRGYSTLIHTSLTGSVDTS
jgi:hypothetical protein